VDLPSPFDQRIGSDGQCWRFSAESDPYSVLEDAFTPGPPGSTGCTSPENAG
jgi:hypothetical protein